MMMKIFKNIFLTLSLLLFVVSGLSAQRLIILHTNDTHSQIEVQTSGRNRDKGGIERRSAYIAKVMAENPGKVLLLDAGDYNQGTPYYTLFKGDVEVKLMNAIGYDVVTLGNHEFDSGQEELARRLSSAEYKTICSNYDFSKTPLKGLIEPYTIVERNGLKIGIIGLTLNLKGFVSAAGIEGLKYQDAIKRANKLAAKLKKRDKCDMVIALTHLGFSGGDTKRPSDTILAENSKDIDVIVGGHSHTYLDEMALVKNRVGKEVVIVQSGGAGSIIGRLDIE